MKSLLKILLMLLISVIVLFSIKDGFNFFIAPIFFASKISLMHAFGLRVLFLVFTITLKKEEMDTTDDYTFKNIIDYGAQVIMFYLLIQVVIYFV